MRLKNTEKKKIFNLLDKSLDNREKYIIYHRVISEETKTLEKLAIELKISRERVRQIKKSSEKAKKVPPGKEYFLEDFIY